MNLHIVPDNVFINKFYENLQESGTVENNRFVVRTNNRELQRIKHNLPFAKLYSPRFNELTGETKEYKKVFIHQFTPLLYRWVSNNHFNELNWMVWGADLYSLPSVDASLYEHLTFKKYVNRNLALKNFLYRAKVALLHDAYRDKAYAKVHNVLTWMTSEYDFALQHLPALKATNQFFFYENDVPYQALDEILKEEHEHPRKTRPMYILGNSSTAELNHLDAVALIEAQNVSADLVVPISYGDSNYSRFMKKNLSYKGGDLRFIDSYMPFQQYLQFLNSTDGLIMNNIRPQGYGNIFIMMYLGKEIFLNPKNLSIPELIKGGLNWRPVSEISTKDGVNWLQNKSAITRLLSHSSLLKIYMELFSAPG
ncbi:MAG: TDP-N-acetylfucosamine:lipid II N-acetylfucosaminyltransferase [Cyclobacteriaceae bacterium]